MKPLFKLGKIGVTPIHLVIAGLAGYLLLKPKTASAAGPTAKPRPTTTTAGTVVSATLSLAPTIAGAIQSWFSSPGVTEPTTGITANTGI